jgi:hypothetical protein
MWKYFTPGYLRNYAKSKLSAFLQPIHRAGNTPRFRNVYYKLRGQNVVNPMATEQHQVVSILRFLEPRKVIGYNKVRVGTLGDGGYVQIDDFAGIVHAFSFGISGNDDWDLGIAERGVSVEQYDHSVDRAPSSHPLLNFHRLKISTQRAPNTATLPDLVAKYSSHDRPDLILKIDIEGAEWDVFDAASEECLSRFSQILCEFHGLTLAKDPIVREKYRRVLEKLSKSFVAVHVHANNTGGLAVIFNVAVPRHIEITFVNRTRYELAPTHEVFPTELDVPCAPFLNEIVLGAFKY